MKKVRKEEAFLQTLSTGISAQEGHENGIAVTRYIENFYFS